MGNVVRSEIVIAPTELASLLDARASFSAYLPDWVIQWVGGWVGGVFKQAKLFFIEGQFSVLDRKFDIAKAWVHFASQSANALFFKSFFSADDRAHLAGEKLEQGGGLVH